MSAEDYRQYARGIIWLYGSPIEVQLMEARQREVEAIHRGHARLLEGLREYREGLEGGLA